VDWLGLVFALVYALAWTLPFRPYVRALTLAGAVNSRLVLGLTAVLASVALLVFPGFGSDVFIYVDYARLWAIYGEHPLLTPPIAQPADWAFQFIWIPTQPSPYGPLWAALTWPIARLAGTSIAAQVAGYKLLALTAYVACGWLIWTWPARQAQRAQALLLFAWSPLVLFETLAKGHNDVLLALSALLALRLNSRGGLVAGLAGGLVKATGLAVLPSLALGLVRRRAWLPLASSALLAAAVAVAAYAPFWRGPETLLPILAQTSRVVWSPGSLLVALGADAGAVRVLLAMLWAATCGVVLWRVRDPVISACLVLLATLLLLTTAFFAHYLVPVIALAAISDHERLRRVVFALSIGAMAAYAVELLNLAFGPPFIGSASFQIIGSLVLLLPPSVVLVAGLRRARPDAARRAPM
jgi:alpha-1,6-mannosyltransferase